MKKYLIIPGSNRSGSTSLYYYLSENGFNTSKEKQIDYLLNQINLTSIENYDDNFKKGYNNILKVDISPDYMYNNNFLFNLKKLFNKSELLIIFLLRDPFDRVVSFHKHGKQIGEVDINESLETFISKNSSNSKLESYRSIDRSDYYKWLNPVIDYLDEGSFFFISTEKMNSQKSIQKLQKITCRSLESTPKFFNQSGTINNGPIWFLYRKFRSLILRTLKFFRLIQSTRIIRFYIGSFLRYSFIKKTKTTENSHEKLRKEFMKDWRIRNNKLFKYLDKNEFTWIIEK